jgi:protein disulfide-isomerase A1
MSNVRAEDVFDNGVLVLTDDNFDEAIAKYDYLLVEFYAPWCGHCKKLAPEYEAAAEVLSAQDPPRTIAKLDATENKAMGDRYEVKGFPTLMWFTNGTKSEYNGGRTKDTIIEWINKKTGPVSLEVDCAAMEEKTSESNLSVSYFGAQEGDLWENYMKSARNPAISEKFQFFHTSDGDCAAKFETSAPGVSITRRFDESPLPYSGAAVEDDIVAFAKGASVPRLITFSEDYIESIFGDRNPAVILFTEEADQCYQSVFAQAAKDLQGELLFVTSGVTEGIQSKLAEFVGVSASDMPTMRLVHPAESMLKYVYEGDASALTGDDVAKFISDFKAGDLQPHLKSQDVSEATTVDGLTIVVGKTWNDVVADPSKDVLVKYYAPWCGHCKSLAPIWDELAKDVEGMDDLIIAKFDATENEVAGVEIQGFPTLIFYPKDNKTGVKFEGDRDLPAFKTYLNENSSAYQAARPAGETESEPVQEEL